MIFVSLECFSFLEVNWVQNKFSPYESIVAHMKKIWPNITLKINITFHLMWCAFPSVWCLWKAFLCFSRFHLFFLPWSNPFVLWSVIFSCMQHIFLFRSDTGSPLSFHFRLLWLQSNCWIYSISSDGFWVKSFWPGMGKFFVAWVEPAIFGLGLENFP